MDKKSKTFFAVFSFIIMISIVATFYKYIVLDHYDTFTDEEVFNESLLDQ